ncbi:hypothetical protein [Promicromonospora sp. NPDC057488]|uniref:hypothetical protein n=1 Tax=Promicromonospora sp. NPDC057488 TaxID=3346147 RepID=UPI00366EE0A5
MLLENSSETDLHPDVAVSGMESIVGELSQMPTQDRIEFLQILASIHQAEGESAVGEFARSLPFMIGFEGGE